MKKAPKVLTRMRLSCYWGDNLDEKELNDVVNYINELEQQCKNQKEVIDKAVLELANIDGDLSNSQLSDRICNLIYLLKEVSE